MTIITQGKLHYKCVKSSEFYVIDKHGNNEFVKTTNYVKSSESYVIGKHGTQFCASTDA
jgi:hypothetical protein